MLASFISDREFVSRDVKRRTLPPLCRLDFDQPDFPFMCKTRNVVSRAVAIFF